MNIFDLIEMYQSDPVNFLRMFEADRITVYVPKKGGARTVLERNVEIRSKLIAGANYSDIMREYGLSERQVRRIEQHRKILS